jgi:glycosyltransferase involved in cell wall biosynthesis
MGEAVRKARTFVGMRLRNMAPSALGHAQGEPAREDTYLHGIWQSLAREEGFHISGAPALGQKRRQVALIGDINLPQCRKYRVEQLAAFWRERGVGFEYAHYQDVPRATRIMQNATHLMEYRLQTMPVTEMLRYEARRLRLPVCYDLDDPLFSISAYETYGNMKAVDPGLKAHFLGEAPKYLSMMNGADILSVSTPGMAEHTQLYTQRPVFVRRNFADAETLDAGQIAINSRAPDDGLFRVAFASGSQGHEIDLAEIIKPLSAFITADPSRRLMVIGHFDPAHLPSELVAQVETVKFSTYTKYTAALARANCAVMPLCDDIFNRCKSAVRVIDAASVGVPSIVGTVGDLQNVVRDGTTGFVAKTPQDWQRALETLGSDVKAARAMGGAARADLEARWAGSDASHIIAPELVKWVEA